MANALDTQALNLEILDMFTHARSRLFIISPYLSVYQNLRKTIEDADGRGVNVVVVYRKVDDSMDTLEWLSSLRNIYLGRSDTLHAKYYGEDHVAIISSLNLYQYSQVNNEELGVIFDDRKDVQAFYDAFFFVQRIVEHSEPVYATIRCEFMETRKVVSKVPDVRFSRLPEPVDNIRVEEPQKEDATPNADSEPGGFCIRCGKAIGADSGIYYCGFCYRSWSQYNNPNYQERYCHICGKPSRTTAYKPVCAECFPGSSDLINAKKDVVLRNVASRK